MMNEETVDDGILISDFLVDDADISLAYRPFSSIPLSISDNLKSKMIKKVDLTETYVNDLTELNKFNCLEILILDRNGLSNLKSCPILKTLHTLWCNNNQITDMEEFIDDVIARFQNLRYLSLMRNPCSPGLFNIAQPDLEACRLYRSYVLYRLPNLLVLDCTVVTKEELVEAKLRGQYAIKSRSVDRSKSTDDKSLRTTTTLSPEDTLLSSREGSSGATSRFKGQVRVPPPVGLRNPPPKNSEGNRFIVNAQL